MAVTSRTNKNTKTSRSETDINLNELLKDGARIPPRNLDAERALLGSLMLDKDAIIKVSDTLTPEQFYDGKHGVIYHAIVQLFQESTPADLVTLSNLLEANSQLEKIGGSGYIADLINAVPTAANIEHYAGIIRENYIRRSLISSSATFNSPDKESRLVILSDD